MTYQVIAECAHVTQETLYGRAKQLVYKGALVADDAPELKHLLSSGMVERVSDDTGVGYNAAGDLGPAQPVVVATPEGGDPELDAKRAEARAKLPKDGAAPHANAGKDVWVEYAVAQGMDRAEADKADKGALVAALKK